MSTPIPSGMATVYTNETPFDTDVLRCSLYKMVDIAMLSQTILGTGLNNETLICGLSCAPISPPGMQVTIGNGTIYSQVDYLATAWGSINSNTASNQMLFKQGILLNSTFPTFNTPAPAGAGNNIIYLIEVQFEEIDVNSISRPYFNPSNPSAPVYTSNYDTRQQTIIVQIKAGTAAPSPTPPTPDAGFTGLYYIAVANGQTSIISGNITVVPGAPFITESLTQKAKTTTVQYSGYNYSIDTGSANAYMATLSPAATAYTVGLQVYLKVVHANTAGSTLNVNGLGTKSIVLPNGTALRAGDLIVGQMAFLIFDGTNFQLQNPINGILADIPTGTILDFGTSTPPAGYLTCDGSAISRTTYAALFAVISTTWGVGDGSTTFNIPLFDDVTSIGSGTHTVGSQVGSNTSSATLAHSHNLGGGAHIPTSNAAWSYGQNGIGGGSTGIAQTANGATVGSITATDSYGSGSSFSIQQLSNTVLKIIKT